VYFPEPRTSAYKGGPIPKSHFEGLSKILKFTNDIITEKLVGNPAAGAKVLALMQEVPIVLSKEQKGNPWSVNGLIGSCKKAYNYGCVLGNGYDLLADLFLQFPKVAEPSTKTLTPMLLHELSHVFDRQLGVNVNEHGGDKPNEYPAAKAVRAAYAGNKLLIKRSKGENTMNKAEFEKLGYDVITAKQNDKCWQGLSHGCDSNMGKWLSTGAKGGPCPQKKRNSKKCFVGNPAVNDGRDDYALGTSLEYFAELTETITQGTKVGELTMDVNDKWPFNKATNKGVAPI
jgi:hypothetical protein